MPLHLAGYLESVDAAAAFTSLTPLADPMLFVQGDNIRVPSDKPKIIMAAGGADGVVIPRMRLTSPTLIRSGRPEVKPLNVQNAAAVVPDSPAKIMWMLENPLQLSPDELLFAELNNNSAAAQQQWLLIMFADGTPAPIVNAPIEVHRFTATTTAAAGVWTNAVITPDDNLQPGTYAVVGLRPQSATMIAARMVFQNDPANRPGALGGATAQSLTDPRFRAGRLGEWGRFPFTQLPTVDILCAAADTAEEFEIDLVRVG